RDVGDVGGGDEGRGRGGDLAGRAVLGMGGVHPEQDQDDGGGRHTHAHRLIAPRRRGNRLGAARRGRGKLGGLLSILTPLMRRSIAVVSLLLAALAARADEGMWTFDDFPFELLAERHGVEITPEWLARVRLGVARLSGCTASVVSPEGLL